MRAPSIIADPAMALAIRRGRKTQLRFVASPPHDHAPGDRLLVREAAVGGRFEDGRPFITGRRSAEFVVYPDGWRQHRDGRGHPGPRLAGDPVERIAAMQMPDWAARTCIRIDWVRRERLQQICVADVRAEGAIALLGGLCWRWPRPIPGLFARARDAYAHYWNIARASAGTRWEDDPEVAVLGFHVEAAS